MAILIILFLISLLIYMICIFDDILSLIETKKRRKKVKREIEQALQESEEMQREFNKFKEKINIRRKKSID